MYQYRAIPPSYPGPLLVRRQNDQNRKNDPGPPSTGLIATVGVVGFLAVAVIVYCALRSVRRRHKNPKYLPTAYLKGVWINWGVPSRGTYEPAGAAAESDPSANTGTGTTSTTANNTSGGARVDRNTSVRSIMTLPPYRIDPTNTERVIGREGERDGVDVVVELPTEENLEGLREDEMEALYQLRLARRQQLADRAQRREARREARSRNDTAALESLRAQDVSATADRSVLELLRSDHERLKNERLSAVSSVAYADVGVARHDGTRIRANSIESERAGLLSDAASIALSTLSGDRRSSVVTERERSDSALSLNTDLASIAPRGRASSGAGSMHRSIHMRADSGSDFGEADVGDSTIPLHSPPGYEDEASDHGRSTTPIAEPPPGYPGRDSSPEAVGARGDNESPPSDVGRDQRPSRRGVGGVPQLPSLRLSSVPQIVIEPSQDQPRER
ncbi:uncharacterized protein DNG_08820 [Cephalotrichum gorgonifer]|uniref:Uncharacterized protein n=1 Tax=Cephalotrichum gorgonifer TaxID=2041049 RepID=A0AAE8N4A4_9PEZI|nr:uncharacterized protein DNG_08820 [Cephalotrichum gorgonifer]